MNGNLVSSLISTDGGNPSMADGSDLLEGGFRGGRYVGRIDGGDAVGGRHIPDSNISLSLFACLCCNGKLSSSSSVRWKAIVFRLFSELQIFTFTFIPFTFYLLCMPLSRSSIFKHLIYFLYWDAL